jgi:hypothetical protein
MELYTSSDIKLLENNIDGILNKLQEKRMSLFGPSMDEIKQVTNILHKFIKDNKRKVYGGYALNLYIKDKNPDDAIYSDKDITPHDIEFYSPEPVKDLIELCNLIHDKGIPYVVGKDAIHKETYKLTVNMIDYCDISYVPKNVYNRMPFKIINGFNLIDPSFMTVDYLRMLSDPINSYWRIEKSFKRFILLNKYYPLTIIKKELTLNESKNEIVNKLLDNILSFLKNKKTTILIGLYALNFYINQSGILKNYNKKYITLNKVPYYEIISINFKEDTNNLINILTKLVDNKDDIKIVEHYPFFQFIGHSAYIYYQDILIAKIIHHYNKCLPKQDIIYGTYDYNKYIKLDEMSIIQIGTFNVTLLFALTFMFQVRTDNLMDETNFYRIMCSHLIESRNYFYNNNHKLNIFSESYFKDFSTDCIGSTLSPERERQKLYESQKKKGKRAFFKYEPSEKKINRDDTKYIFLNSSGNPVINKKNLKLSDDINNDDMDSDNDDSENIINNDIIDN